jgi:hypothetical protein
MKPKRFAFTLEHTALAFALMLAHAQGASAGTTTVALTGQFAPGLGVLGRFSTFEAPLLNTAGQVAFQGSILVSGINASNSTGIWSNGGLIARTGTSAPGAGSGTTFASFSGLQLNAAGQVAYEGTLAGASVTAANDTGIWRNNTLLVRKGHAAPGAGAGVSFSEIRYLQLNAAGQVAFKGLLTGPGVTQSNGSGIWQGSTLIARQGDRPPQLSSTVNFAGFGAPLMNASGQVAFRGSLEGSEITSLNNSGIWRNNTLIAHAGDSAPGLASGVRFRAFTDLQINDDGQVAFRAGTNSGAGAAGIIDGSAIWRDSTLIARSDDIAPGTGSGVRFTGLWTPVPANSLRLNAAGQVAFSGSLKGDGVSDSNDSGIWRNSTLIVRTGDAAPGAAGGATFASLSNHQLNTGGQLAFEATLTGAGGSGLYLGDGPEIIEAARTGGALAGSTITSLSASGSSFNDKAQLAYQATLADGRSGVFLFTPTLHWRSTTSGSWEDAARWTLGVNPADVHDVIVDAANSLRITGPTAAVTVKSLQVGTGAGLVTLQMAGGSIAAGEPVLIGARGVLSGTGSFSGPVVNQGTVQAGHLAMSAGLRNAGLVRGVAGGPQTGAGLDTDLLNQASGRVLVQPGETLQLRGASHRNEGVFEINQGRLEVAGNLLNASGGVIDLNRATAVADGAWTNAAGARLLLSDARLTVSSSLTNNGQVLVTSGDSDVFGRVVNQIGGQILLSGQGSTTFYDAVELQAGSELRTSAGATAVFFGAVAQRSGALLTGTGRKYFEGGLSIGNSPGLGEDAGSVSFGLGSTYLAEIGGMVLGTGYDHYRVAGTLTLGGTLQLVSFAGFTGEAGQQFDLFDWGALQGQFNHIDSSGLQLAAGTTLDVSRLYIDGVISVTAVPEPGSWALMAAGLAGLAGLRRRNAVRKG